MCNQTVNRRSKDSVTTNRKWTKEQTMIYKTLHKKLKIGQHELHKKAGDAPKVPAPLVTSVMLLLSLRTR